MTIQPPWLPLVRLRRTFATTPSPKMTRIIVPMSSATNACIETSSTVAKRHLSRGHDARIVAGPDAKTPPIDHDRRRLEDRADERRGSALGLAGHHSLEHRLRLAAGPGDELRLDGVLVLDVEGALVRVHVHVGIEVGAAVERELDLAGFTGGLE